MGVNEKGEYQAYYGQAEPFSSARPGGGIVSITHEQAKAFVNGYGRAWEAWDAPAFADLFSDDVVYVEHPTDETLVGKNAMIPYLQKEEVEQGAVSVQMGNPIVDANQVVAEFWATGTTPAEQATLIGCFIAQLDPADGRCIHFRQYWFDVKGHRNPYQGWGE